ncbi:MAG: hypothetical protein ACJ748_14755 [Flavisolibacter sp.]
MKKFTLLFPNETELRRFVSISQSVYLEMNVRTLKIICVCNSEEVELAVKAFKAEIIAEERI